MASFAGYKFHLLKDKMIKSFFSQSVRSFLFLPLISSFLFATACNKDSSTSGPYNPRNPLGEGPAPVELAPGGTVTPGDMSASGSYVILSKTGISNVTGSMVTGDMGVSPAAATYITGFSLIAHASNVYSTSASVVGNIYAANYAVPTPTNLTSAIGSMETAYNYAAARNPPDVSELLSGDIGNQSLTPGLYKWSSSVTIPLDLTLTGGANDIWIFQIAGNLSIAASKSIILAGGALPKNIYWQVAGQVSLGSSSHFEGIILAKTAVIFQTLASLNGRVYSQTMVTLDNNTITKP
jgi:hypothetical protein